MSLFKTELLEQEVKNYSRLELSSEQRPMMDGIAKIIGQFLEINHLALKGFIWRSLKDLQVEHNVTTKDIGAMEPQERGKFALEAFDNLKGYLKKVLRDEANYSVIDNSIDQGIEFYKENFMFR